MSRAVGSAADVRSKSYSPAKGLNVHCSVGRGREARPRACIIALPTAVVDLIASPARRHTATKPHRQHQCRSTPVGSPPPNAWTGPAVVLQSSSPTDANLVHCRRVSLRRGLEPPDRYAEQSVGPKTVPRLLPHYPADSGAFHPAPCSTHFPRRRCSDAQCQPNKRFSERGN